MSSLWSFDRSKWALRPNVKLEPLYSAATVTALEAEVRELRAGLERVLSSMSSYDAALADHLRKSITGAGAK